MLRVLAVTVVIAVRVAAADPFEPPSSVAAAEEHYTRGKALFAAKQYADAAAEFQSALDLDPSSKFLLFNLGLARRMAGACGEAVTAYQQFLDASPPEKYAANARVGIEKCQDVLAHAPPLPDKPVEPPITPLPPAEPPVTPVTPPRPVEAQPAAPRVVRYEPWYHDRIGNVLTGVGLGALAVSGFFLINAHGESDMTYSSATLAEYHQHVDGANNSQGLSLLLAGAGAVLISSGLVHYVVHTRKEIVVQPAASTTGASLAVEVAW